MRVRPAAALREIRWRTLGRVYRRFSPYVLRSRVPLLGALFCLLGSVAAALLRPWPLKIVFDFVLPGPGGEPRPLPPSLDWLLPSSATGLLAVACAGVVATTTLGGLFAYGQNLLSAQAAHRILFRIRRDLFAHVQRLPLAFHSRRETGDLLMRMTGDVLMLREILVNAVVRFTGRLLVIAGMILIMVWISPLLTLVAVSVLPLLILVLLRFSGRLRHATRRQRQKEGKVATVISETISFISVVQSFSRAAHEDSRLARQNRGSRRAGLRATRIQEGMTRSAEAVVALGTCGVLAVGAHFTLRGWITAGDLLVFLSYVSSLYKPLREISRLTGRLAKASVCAERVLDLLEMERKIADAPDAVEAPLFRGAVRFQDVTLQYDQRSRPALAGLDLDVRAGETVLLVGESGAGKTSVAKLLLRLYDPTSGTVLIDGVDIRRFKLDSLREQIAVVLQESLLFGTTIRENIAYGKPDASQEEIVQAARNVHAHEFIERLPDGYDTVVGEGGSTLSGGQRQRIALARAAIKNAPLLILDEPTTGLDEEAERAVLDGMSALMRDSTTFIITHRRGLFEDADRVVLLDEGRARGPGVLKSAGGQGRQR